MQIRVFTIPIFDDGKAQETMNKFLRGAKVLSIKEELVQHSENAYWCYSVRYLPALENKYTKKGKIDYKEVLDDKTFKIFSDLRVARKKIADELQLPAFAIFTNEELSKIAKLDNLEASQLQSIDGIGKSKVEKYGQRILELYTTSSS